MALAKQALAVAGSKLYVSATLPTTRNQTGFEVPVYTEVGNVIDLGQGFGRQYQTTNFESVSNPEIEKIRTNFDSGAPNITYAVPRSGGDSGQDIIKAAVDSGDYISVKLLLSNGDALYGTAMINGMPLNLGTVGSIMQYQSTFNFFNDGTDFVHVAAV